MIWVRDSERAAINQKRASLPWATGAFNGIVNRIAAPLASYEANKDTFLRQLPVSWSAADPVLSTAESQVRGPLRDKLEDAQDAALLHFLTLDERYARFAADILHNVIEGYTGLAAPGSSGNTGWLLPTDHLKEVREVATESPIIYDFIYDWLKAGNKVWDVKSATLVDFNFDDAQMVFRTYVRLAREVGHTGSNWSVLESPSLVHNALALDDPAERAAAIRYYLDTDTSKQDSLKTVAKSYAAAGDIWPESFQYSGAVNAWSNYLMVLLERYDPANHLYAAYPNIAWSLKRPSELIFPNGDAIRFGDGHRDIGEPYFYYEIVYAHAVARGYADLQARYGALINAGVAAGRYNRASVANYQTLSPREAPLQLLWFAESVAESANVFTLPRTDTLPFAGVALQRNLSPTGNARNSLMAWVGGAAHVHSHATGMNLELFGAGEILGADGGLTAYGDTITENYYRVFAAHNTVIVNGASRGQGGWGDLGMETVQTVAMEPQAFAPAVSSDFSFTCSSFNDTRGTRAEATQQRTVALIRTSPTTGFYVDFFRSDSRLSSEFHDYIYHNVGDALVLRDSAGAAIPLSADATRFQNDIGDTRQQPGWRYFEDALSSGPYAGFVHARFTANNLPAGSTRMDVFIPGAAAREYTAATAPPIKEISTTYDNRRAPTLVIRRTGEAWAQPFIAVYEPTYGTAAATIRSVETIERAGTVVGVKVVSLVGPKTLTHYVLSLPTVSTYTDAALNLSFTGRFAIVNDNDDSSGALYLGSGSSLSYRNLKIASRSGVTTAAELRSAPGQAPVLTANSPIDLTAEGAPVIATSPATQAVAPGSAVTFSVAASGTAPLSYQWKYGGAPIAGATSSTYVLPGAQAANMGFYSVTVSNPSGATDSAAAILTVTGGSSRLINVSTRGYVPPGGELTPGFVFKGVGTKKLLIRAIGPTLADFGLAGVQLTDPKMEVIPFGRTTAVASNDNWGTHADLAEPNVTRIAVGAFELSTGSRDAAVLATLSTATNNAYTVRIAPSGTATDGIALAEVYDTEALTASVRLGNVSTLGFVGTGGQVLTPGLVIGGDGAKLLLIRAIGPGLTPFGVPAVLADPQLAVIPAGQAFPVAGNDDWGATPALRTAFAQVGAFATIDSRDAAVVVRLPPGGYTVVVSDAGGRSGTALVEVYDMDP